jgi:hypothetical protein
VPEDLQSILTDSTLHNGSAELTTKDILTRYGDIARGKVSTFQRGVQGPDYPASGPISTTSSLNNRTNGPVATRIDVNTSQQDAWQKQSSVRPVQNSTSGGPVHDFNFGTPNTPYARERGGSQSSQGSYGAGAGQRGSYQQKPGPLGVTG